MTALLSVEVPGDKSLSHRALILAALSTGRSRLTGVLDSADIRSTAECLRRLGVSIPEIGPSMVIDGHGVAALEDPETELDCGNSGTTTRLLAGVIAGAARTATFIGDASLSKRPMKRIADPLGQMGARVTLANGDGLPMQIAGGHLRELHWESRSASAQVKSAILLAGLTSRVTVSVTEPSLSRDHTERMLEALGAPISRGELVVTLTAGSPDLQPLHFDVPGDPSSAAFFAAWALLAGRTVRTNAISTNPTRIGFLNAIQQMGARVEITSDVPRCGEPVGWATISGSLTSALDLDPAHVPGMIDELPLLACVAAYAPGDTRVVGARELRVKESDRIATVVSNLRAIGAQADELPDGFIVHGASRVLAGHVITHGDHRIAMAFGVLGALPGNRITIDDPECAGVSFPGFWAELARLKEHA